MGTISRTLVTLGFLRNRSKACAAGWSAKEVIRFGVGGVFAGEGLFDSLTFQFSVVIAMIISYL